MYKYVFLLLLFILFIENIKSQGTGNTYQFFSTPTSLVNAKQNCINLNSYLLVVNNKIEYDYVKVLSGGSNFWVSGTTNLLGKWNYLPGTNPENNAVLYDVYTEKCTLFCDWNSNSPALDISKMYIYFSNISNSWETIDSTGLQPYICEKGPAANEQIFSQLPPGSSSQFNVTGIYGLFFGTIKFRNLATNLNYSCSISIDFLSGVTTCSSMPSSQPGLYNITIQQSIFMGGAVTNRMYQFNAPVLTSIYPSGFTAGSIITISGIYLGSDISRIETTFSDPTSPVICSPNNFIPSSTTSTDQIYTCTLASDITGTLYPVSISINLVTVKFFSLPVYYSQKYISCSGILVNNNDIVTFANTKTVSSLAGNLDIVDSIGYYSFLSKICNYQVWQGAIYQTSPSPSFINYLTSINTPVYYSNLNLNGLTPGYITSYDMSSSLLLDNSLTSFGGLIYFKKTSPIEFISNKTTIITTQGGPITFNLTNVGNIFDTVSMSIGQTPFTGAIVRDLINNKISVTLDVFLPSQTLEISFVIGGVSTSPQTQFISIGPITINSISPGSTQGGRIYIDGTNLYNNISLLKFTFVSFPCTSLRFEILHQELSCIIPIGYGFYYTGTLTFNDTVNVVYTQFAYANPTISKFSKIGGQGGLVTVTGFNFYNDISILKLSTQTVGNCTGLQFTKPHTEFTCTIPSGNVATNNGYTNTVTVGPNKFTVSKKFNYEKPSILSTTQTLQYNQTGVVGIVGNYFSNINLSAFIGGVPCLISQFVDPQHINCTYNGSVPPIQNNTVAITVSVNCSKSFQSGDVFFYQETPIPCPGTPACLGRGECINSQCQCKEPYGSIDCSIIPRSDVDPPTPGKNGETSLPGNGFNFSTTVAYIRELDTLNNDATVKLYKISNFNWTKPNDTDSTDTSNQADYLLYNLIIQGTYENDSVVVDMDFKIFKKDYLLNFAGDILVVPKNSVKYNIKVSNWTFASELNVLQIIFLSQSPKDFKKPLDKCSTLETQSNSSLLAPKNDYGYQIQLDDSILEAKFAKRYYLNSRISQTNIKLLPNDDPLVISEQSNFKSSLIVMTSISIPSFNGSCIIDPSFVALIKATNDSSSSNSDCGSNLSDSKNWKKIVIIVVPVVVGGALIVALGIYISKKRIEKRYSAKLKGLDSKFNK